MTERALTLPYAAAPAAPATARERLVWLDVAKGLGILLVVVGHAAGGLIDSAIAGEDAALRSLFLAIYAFHMPLFFMLSGILVEKRVAADPGKFRRSLLTSLLWPYFLWSVLQYSAIYLAGSLVNQPVQDYWRPILMLPFNPVSQFWFLYALFLLHVAGLLLLPRLGAMSFFLLCLVLKSIAPRLGLPGILSDMAAMAPYYALGVLLGVGGLRAAVIERPWPVKAVLLPVLAAAVLVLSVDHFLALGQGISPDSKPAAQLAKIAWSFDGMAAALLGCGAVVAASSLAAVQRIDILAYLGRMSLPIFLMHILFIAGTRIVLVKILGLDAPLAVLPIVVVAGVLGPLVAAEIARRLGLARLLGL